MHTKQIIHNSEGSANAEITSLEAKLKHLHLGSTTDYTYWIKHPVDNKWAVRYDTEGRYWELVEDHLNPHQISSLVDIDDDWFNEQEI